MPARRVVSRRSRRGRRSYRRRRMYRRRRRMSSAMSISTRRMPAIFPDCAMVKFKYSTLESIVLDQSTLTSLTYSLNSVYDPEYAIGGGQPIGYDEWSGFYLKYLVYASHIKLEFIMAGVNPIEVYLGPDNDASAPTSPAQYVMQPYYKHKVVNSAWAPATKITHCCSVATLEGRAIGSEDDYASSTSSNPFKRKFWQVGLFQNHSVPSVTLDVRVTITYYTKMFQRRTTMQLS